MIQVLVSDLDYTVVTATQKEAPQDVVDAMIRLQEAGITLVLATGRTHFGATALVEQFKLKEYGGYLVSCTGAEVYDCKNETILYRSEITDDLIHELFEYTRIRNLNFKVEQSKHMICTDYDPGIEYDFHVVGVDAILTKDRFFDYIKEPVYMMAITQRKELLDQYTEEINQRFSGKLFPQRSGDYFIDFVNHSVSKETGVQVLLDILGMSWQNVAAIGDGENDLPLLRKAGISATLENGKDIVKQTANKIVSSVDDNGIIEFVDFILAK